MKSFTNFVRAMVRPFVTMAMVGLIWYLGLHIIDILRSAILSGQITGDQILLLATMVIEFILAAGATILAFHFSSRTKERTEDAESEK